MKNKLLILVILFGPTVKLDGYTIGEEVPTEEAEFGEGNDFEENELVLVPRSGGYHTVGKINVVCHTNGEGQREVLAVVNGVPKYGYCTLYIRWNDIGKLKQPRAIGTPVDKGDILFDSQNRFKDGELAAMVDDSDADGENKTYSVGRVMKRYHVQADLKVWKGELAASQLGKLKQ